MTATLTKTQKILNLIHVSGKSFLFAQLDEDTYELVNKYELSEDDWIDMGQPRQITLTIHPGDLLND